MDQLEQLDEQYREHHRTSRERDFVYAGHDRSELFARYVAGPGRRVRDIGCRTGALTRAYLEGNEVVGLDVDRKSLAEAAKLGIETHWADADQPLPMGGIPSTTRRSSSSSRPMTSVRSCTGSTSRSSTSCRVASSGSTRG